MNEPGPPAPPADRSLLDEAVQLARSAGDLTLRWFRAAGLDRTQDPDFAFEDHLLAHLGLDT